MDTTDPKDIVRRGYDALAARYDEAFGGDTKYRPWLDELRRLRPGGRFVATTGHGAWTGTDEDWLGGGAPMWWSHTDAAGYREWITRAGLTVEREEYVPEGGDTGHTLFWARKPVSP
ncbi:hypothetical protein [Streptomyces sp. AC602_WCS936]|uniref:hypothetical protein n=1 Tax=Streptomyces sp. AC602_WCS936 TaxID=2823685 RepID=UPI001C261616|nr:hypothetical protein [Streptomyces sp. AC602_WCS936]